MKSILPYLINKLIPVFVFFYFFGTTKTWGQCATVIAAFPYHEDFETSNGGWASGGANNDWIWGVPVKPVIISAGSGSKCWITGGTTASFYNFSERSYVESPCFDFSLLTNPYITLRIFWDTEYTYDGANLQYSTDGGASWTNVGAYGDAIDCMNDNWYNFASVNNLASLTAVKNGWCGTIQPSSGSCIGGGGSGIWKFAKHRMPYLAGEATVKFRIIFGAGTTCNNYDGFAFDDITIKNAAPAITVNQNLQPSGCVINNGAATLSVNGGVFPYSYLWNPNVSSTNVATSLNAGNYTVTISDAMGCSKINSFTISQTPAISLNTFSFSDTCKRNVGAATVAAHNGSPPFYYQWNPTGTASASINNLSQGSYIVMVTDAQGCTASAITIIDIYGDFKFNLGNDTTICSGNGFIISPGKYDKYLWQDHSVDSVFNVVLPGSYWVEVTSNAGCKAQDTLAVIEDCLHDVMVPNAFSPNEDEKNDIFFASAVSVKNFDMKIYNRWGETIFTTTSIKQGWNGTFKNSKCETGIYWWVINYFVEGTEPKEKSGTVLLVR